MLTKPLTPRADVYAAIDSERDYQDEKWGPVNTYGHEPAAWLLYMEHHLMLARQLITTSSTTAAGAKGFLDQLRKVTALGVAAMEQHGAPTRERVSS